MGSLSQIDMVIMSQASNEEGATTILYGVGSSDPKRPTPEIWVMI